MSKDILGEAFNATVSRDYEKAVAVIRQVLGSSNHPFSVEQLELIDHVYSCILNTSHYDESLIEVCWEWIEAIERTPRTVDTRAISSSQLSIYYAYHTICRVQERMPRKPTHQQIRQDTWTRITHSFSYLWAAATQLWKTYELDRLDILCSWSYLCFQFADVVTEEVLAVIETSKENAKGVLSSVIVFENGHQANQRLLTVERNIKDARVMAEKLGRKLNNAEALPITQNPAEDTSGDESPPPSKKWLPDLDYCMTRKPTNCKTKNGPVLECVESVPSTLSSADSFTKKAKKEKETEEEPMSLIDIIASSFVEHSLTVDQIKDLYPDSYVFPQVAERSDGLHSDEAKKRLKDGGLNQIDPAHEPNLSRFFLSQFHFKFWILLIGAAILSVMTYFIHMARGFNEPLNMYCAVILIAVVIFMGILSYWQQSKAKKVLQENRQMMPAMSYVIRDCEEQEIKAEEVVVGDLVYLRAGYKVPADMRILQSNSLMIASNEITGHLLPREYKVDPVPIEISVFDACNVAFMGSYCTEGEGIGIVIRTGKFTVMGALAHQHHHIPPPSGRLQTELQNFSTFISIVAISMATAVFFVGCFVARFENILDHFIVGFVVIIVANVPQGLPATVMSQLRIIARRMAQKNILIKKLELIDELGAATVICADKSGTLTMNQMVVTDLWFNSRLVTGAAVDLKHPHLRAMKTSMKSPERLEEPLPDILTVMSVCNNGQFEHKSASEAMLSAHMKKKFTIVDTRTGQVSEAGGVCKEKTNQASDNTPESGSRARKHANKTKKNDIFGVPSDVALIKYVELSASVEGIRQRYQTVFEIPFNSTRRCQMVISKCLASDFPVTAECVAPPKEGQSRFVIFTKGAPEVILGKCSKVRHGKDLRDIDEKYRKECQEAWEMLGNEGRRVIAFAEKNFNADENAKFGGQEYSGELVFLGMAAIMDPPRPETAAAIEQCKQAGTDRTHWLFLKFGKRRE
ncbi:unnamed protein product [Caenorhabditis sp. 36 PRJEB53466]|nr:unnamed protein product [Caenorhabditis sp. 36 PRJEB53466]